jgi:predicted metal-dependent HD superfamily phosphohydrolase
MATKRHLPKSLDKTGKVLVDADLATLSARSDRYQTYANAIRREYAWVPEPVYRAGRAALLRAFVERPSIYRTRGMRRHESDARSNLLREIKLLEEFAG